MKSLLLAIGIASLPALVSASETKVINSSNLSLSVLPTDVVQILTIIHSSPPRYLNFTFENGASSKLYIAGGDGLFENPGITLTGVTGFSVNADHGSDGKDNLIITLKITHQGEELTSPPVVMPPVADGRYTISLETSTDLENWAPSAPGDYLGSATARFFRVKAFRNPDSSPAATTNRSAAGK